MAGTQQMTSVREYIYSASVGFGIAVFALITALFMVLPLTLYDPALADPDVTASRSATILMMVLNFVGFAVAGLLYLSYTDRGLGYIDLRLPTRRDWKYIFLGTAATILFIIAFGILVDLIGLESEPSDVIDIVADDRALLLAMFVIVFFANAPAEEFLFRNVIQKRLNETYGMAAAVVLASIIFTAVHFPLFFTGVETIDATAVSLFGLFIGSLVFGYIYAKTENLVVPTLAHAGYNSFQFLLLYILLEYGDPDTLPQMLTLLSL